MLDRFLTANTTGMRVWRTIIQGIIALIPGILNYYLPYMPEWCGIVLVPIIMAILSPIMAEIGKAIEKDGTSDSQIGGAEDGK